MSEAMTRVTLFIPGTPSSVRAWNKALDGRLAIQRGVLAGKGVTAKVGATWVENDGHFGEAFAFGTVADDVVATIDEAPGALVLEWPIDLREGREEIVAAVRVLHTAGALAVRLEQSKLGWDAATWLEMFASRDAVAWHRCAVAILSGKTGLQSCGMHAFSLPDVRIVWEEAGIEGREALHLANVLDVYQLDEDPVMRSGERFAPDAETPKRVMERWPDTAYPPDHPCHNPYGVWRLGAPGGQARSLGELVPVFIPALRAVLAAQSGKLTKKLVEAIRDDGACVMMTPRDAQRLERERGYADVDPELAWEQWKLVRDYASPR
ncbi:MAG: hypothetical protein ACKV2T_15980 [Kofleriaceae bacterium]